MATRAEIEKRFGKLLEEYGRLLRHAIARTCPGFRGVSIDDVEQDARMRLWRALGREKNIERPASFLYRIAVTATVDAMRRVSTRRETQLGSEGANAGEPGMDMQAGLTARQESPERAADRRRLLEQVLARLHDLPTDRRRAVALHLQGFTSGEIAELMQWTEPRARNLAYRGLDELRQRLREEGIEYDAE